MRKSKLRKNVLRESFNKFTAPGTGRNLMQPQRDIIFNWFYRRIYEQKRYIRRLENRIKFLEKCEDAAIERAEDKSIHGGSGFRG